MYIKKFAELDNRSNIITNGLPIYGTIIRLNNKYKGKEIKNSKDIKNKKTEKLFTTIFVKTKFQNTIFKIKPKYNVVINIKRLIEYSLYLLFNG